jgi:hypothetical protein
MGERGASQRSDVCHDDLSILSIAVSTAMLLTPYPARRHLDDASPTWSCANPKLANPYPVEPECSVQVFLGQVTLG